MLASISFVFVGLTGRLYCECGEIVIASSIVKKLCVIALFNESAVGKNGVVDGGDGRLAPVYAGCITLC